MLPVITGKENNKQFLLRVAPKTSKAVLVHIVDNAVSGTDLQEEIQRAEVVMEEMEKYLHQLGVKVVMYNEWGDWKKVENIAVKEDVDHIFVMDSAAKEKLGLPVAEVA